MKIKVKPLSLVLLGAVVGAPLSPAIAQSRTMLEEVIVTAQKREEAIQDVPIAITALGADALKAQGVDNLVDLQGGQVPSLKVVQFAGRPNTIQLGIRGVTESDPTQLTVERPIAVYVDGVYIARGNGMDTEVFDTERIEVLRGPQGTLFGRNAMGGALNITTRKPGGEFGFRQELEASTLDEYKARTRLDTPSWNGFSASLGYLHRQANGWVNNPGGKEDFNWQEKDGYRIAMQYEQDNLVVDYSYDHSDVDYMHNYTALLHKPAASTNPRPVDRKRLDSAWAGTTLPVQSTKNEGHNLVIEWILNDNLTFKSITGYRELEDNNGTAGAGASVFLPGPFLPGNPQAPTTGFSDSQVFAVTRQDQHSQEFQLIGDMDRWEWQVGALYFHEDGTFNGWSGMGWQYQCPSGGLVVIGGNPVPVGYGAACDTPPTPLPSDFTPRVNTLTDVETDSYGVFAQATWNPPVLDDRLRITLGLRYGKDDKDIRRPLEAGQPVAITANTASERVDPALTIAYQLLPDTSIYARYSTAYRGGGVSVREVYTFTPYEEEEVESVELGIKSTFWDNRARINAAVFYNEIDNFVVSVQQTDCGPLQACTTANTVGRNADGIARTHGAELEASVLLLDGLTLSLAYTYLDESIPLVLDGTQLRQPSLPNAPRNAWAVNLDYAFEPFSFGQLNAHIGLTDSDEYCFNPFSCNRDSIMIAEDIQGLQGGDNNRLLNARLTLSEIPLGRQAGTMAVSLWGKNLTDEEYINFGYTAPSNRLVGNNTAAQFGEPRSLGVTMIYEY